MSSDHSEGQFTLRRREVVQRDFEREQREDAQTRLKAAIDECAVQLGRAEGAGPVGTENPYVVVAELCRTELLPRLAPTTEARLNLDDELNDDPDWHWDAISRFANRPEQFARWAATGDAQAADVIERAFYSLEAAAAIEGSIESRYRTQADATGFAIKLGEHKQKPSMDFGDPVKAITRRIGSLKHFFTGGTAGGKSSGAARQFEDYYRASVGGGRDYKCMDLVGISTENVDAFDVPLHDDQLRRVRDDHDLPQDWTDIEDYQPKAEIYVPLTPGVRDYKLPYDTQADEWVPTPFTIPASGLSEGLLSAVIAARVSEGEDRVIRQAYKQVDRRHSDWSLDELARVIISRDELSERDKEGAATIIKNLKSSGFIRTRQHDLALDEAAWDELWHSTDTVTVFNQSPVPTDLGQYLLIAYLIDQVWTQRISAHNLPDLVAWLRELHTIVPHREIRRREDDAVENVMEFIISRMNKIMRLPRDLSVHLIADTQDPTDPVKGIRKRFNRYVIFGGSSRDIEDIFDWANQDGARAFKGTVGDKPGRAGIIKGCEPAITSTNRWGISPVHLTPPSWHHHDKDEGPSGWQKRAEISQEIDVMHDEELRYPDWDIDTPKRAVPTSPANSDGGASDDNSDESAGMQSASDSIKESLPPEERYSRKELVKMKARKLRATTRLSFEKIAARIPNNPDTGKSYNRTTVRNWARDIDRDSGDIDLDVDPDEVLAKK